VLLKNFSVKLKLCAPKPARTQNPKPLAVSLTTQQPMTNNNLLDAILSSYLWGQKLKLDKDPKYNKLTFRLVVKAQDPSADDWQIELLKKQLFDDGFLEVAKFGDEEPYELTPAGIKAAQTRWYSKYAADKQKENDIKDHTIADLKRSKYSLVIAILAFLIPTIISVYTMWTNNQQPTTVEVQELRQRIQKLELKSEAKTASTVSATNPADSLKKENSNKHN
jgi:hypothetical protein